MSAKTDNYIQKRPKGHNKFSLVKYFPAMIFRRPFPNLSKGIYIYSEQGVGLLYWGP